MSTTEQKRCETCKHFELVGDSDRDGECRRYPLMVEKEAYQWCGEHTPVKPAQSRR